MAATFALHLRQNALERVRPVYTPEVLAQKARDLISRLGYNSQPADEADGFGQ